MAEQTWRCSDQELIEAVEGYTSTRELALVANEAHMNARIRLVKALQSRGINPGVIT